MSNAVPINIAGWLACLVFVLTLGLLVVKVAQAIRGRPEAAEVAATAAERYVTRELCDKLHAEANMVHRDLFSKMGGIERGAAAALSGEVRALRTERKEDALVLQGRLDKFTEQLGGLKAASDIQTAQLARMDEKLDELMRE